MNRSDSQTLREVLDALVAEATCRDVPDQIAQAARRATERRFPASPMALTDLERRRAEAYFSAVVRRRAVRRGAPAGAAARFVVAAVVEDLRASGRDGDSIWRELERGWLTMPTEVLEEYRLRLCG